MEVILQYLLQEWVMDCAGTLTALCAVYVVNCWWILSILIRMARSTAAVTMLNNLSLAVQLVTR